MTDSILIVGGGVAGLTAAMTCAEAGARAVVIERDAIVTSGPGTFPSRYD